MIEVKNISKRYRNTVLDDISFTAEKGQCVGIIGANGCGKTTLLSIMAGVNKAQSGKIYYNNELADKKSVFKKYIAYVPQENPLIDELTTKDNLLLWLGSNKKIKDGFENGVLKDLGIDEFLNKQVNELSGGMKRRLSIGISLSNNAPIMLLDEPGSALDIYGKQEVNSYILNYVKNGGTVVMSTHDRDEIDLCTKLYKIEDGILKECEG
ncbi:MAG: ATP-binding cassette domain-containing protein [Eubacterium sp.]|jgi:ABC-2 type transport system ATP-binding protein|nr:ATP-binding cassette domain-containing protein [Eubacterium sp.]